MHITQILNAINRGIFCAWRERQVSADRHFQKDAKRQKWEKMEPSVPFALPFRSWQVLLSLLMTLEKQWNLQRSQPPNNIVKVLLGCCFIWEISAAQAHWKKLKSYKVSISLTVCKAARCVSHTTRWPETGGNPWANRVTQYMDLGYIC